MSETDESLGHELMEQQELDAMERVESKIAPRIASGTAILRALRNEQIWVDVGGRVWKLEEMTTSHRANALRFIRKRAPGLAQSAWWGLLGELGSIEDGGDQARLAVEGHTERQLRLCEEDPAAWLDQMPLVRRLATMVEEDDRRSDRREARFVPRRDRPRWSQR